MAFRKPPENNGFVRSKKRSSWWRRVQSEAQADYVRTWLDHRGIPYSVQFIDLAEVERKRELNRAAARHRAREDATIKVVSGPMPSAVVIPLNPDRNRSGGRRSYAEHRKSDLSEVGTGHRAS
jgi:hypothetical protein